MRAYIWNTDKTKKIKLKEIRDFNITPSEDGSFSVIVYGGFGGPVTLTNNLTSLKECVEFIDSLTEKPE